MTKNVCLTPYLWNRTSDDCVLVHMCKMMISLTNLFIFQNFDFWGLQGDKTAKNDLKLAISVFFALYLRNCRSYHQDFDNDIYRVFFFKKKCNIANIEIICFLLAHFNNLFNNYLFFKFINKYQKEILRCATPFSMCVIFCICREFSSPF